MIKFTYKLLISFILIANISYSSQNIDSVDDKKKHNSGYNFITDEQSKFISKTINQICNELITYHIYLKGYLELVEGKTSDSIEFKQTTMQQFNEHFKPLPNTDNNIRYQNHIDEVICSYVLITMNMNNFKELRSHLNKINSSQAIHDNFVDYYSKSTQEIMAVLEAVNADIINLKNFTYVIEEDITANESKTLNNPKFHQNSENLNLTLNTDAEAKKFIKDKNSIFYICDLGEISNGTIKGSPTSNNINIFNYYVHENYSYESVMSLIVRLDNILVRPQHHYDLRLKYNKILSKSNQLNQLNLTSIDLKKIKTFRFKIQQEMLGIAEADPLFIPKFKKSKKIIISEPANIPVKTTVSTSTQINDYSSLLTTDSNDVKYNIEVKQNKSQLNKYNKLSKKSKDKKKKLKLLQKKKQPKQQVKKLQEDQEPQKIILKQNQFNHYISLFSSAANTKITWSDFISFMADIIKQTGGAINPIGGSRYEFTIGNNDDSKKFVVHANHQHTDIISPDKIRHFILPGLEHVGLNRQNVRLIK